MRLKKKKWSSHTHASQLSLGIPEADQVLPDVVFRTHLLKAEARVNAREVFGVGKMCFVQGIPSQSVSNGQIPHLCVSVPVPRRVGKVKVPGDHTLIYTSQMSLWSSCQPGMGHVVLM
jgi:hypothetical protein